MITEETKEFLTRSSQRAAFLSLVGVVIVVGSLLFSVFYLRRKIEQATMLSDEIEEKQEKIRNLDLELSEKQKKLEVKDEIIESVIETVNAQDPKLAQKAFDRAVRDSAPPTNPVTPRPTPSTPSNTASTVKLDRLPVAKAKEREGFQLLVDGNYAAAAEAFQASENAYPTFHNVYELARILKKNGVAMADPKKKKEIFQLIAKKHSYGAPLDLWPRVLAIANQ